MGHIRLGTLPRTRQWAQVVGLIAGGAKASQVANASITAAERGLDLAARDKGVIETVWLLTQLPLAAREDDFAEGLRNHGLIVPDSPGLLDVVAAVTETLDAAMPNCKGRTDLGEMAQMAAAETLTEVIGGRTRSLFEVTPEEVRQAFAQLATVKQFSRFAKDFFARFTNKCLAYFLSRALPLHVGEGRRFATLAEQAEFSEALRIHCREAAKIVERYAGEWFSKTRWEQQGIPREAARRFTSRAMGKLLDELKQGARPDAN